MLKKLSLFLITLFMSFGLLAQVITTDPAFPQENQSVILTFHADQGDEGLKDYTGDIYAHTGVITDNSNSGSDWKYVIAGWTENTDKAKLTRISTNTYELEITGSIREFYEVPAGEEIQKIALVFRDATGGQTGRDVGGLDIFTDVYEAGLNVDMESPIKGTIVDLNETIQVKANGTDADFTKFYINDILISEFDPEGFTYDYTATTVGKTSFRVEAYSGANMVADSSYIFVKGDVVVEALPNGMKDGVNYLNDHSVILSLLAPYKEYAFAIGDFSNWEVNDDVFMKQTPDGERFWIQIDNLEANQSYIYQYYIDGELKVADVYSEQISNPWDDSYIDESIFPNLIEYPFGLTTGIASVFTMSQEEYDWQVADFVAPKVTDMVVYEVLIRDIHEDHSFQFLIDTISYFKNLGINTIELMPINEFEGNNSWGYNPAFYFAVDKYYGTKNKLKEFIDLCHENGIAVVIDMVLNHSYGQNPQVQMYWDGSANQPAENSPWFNKTSPNSMFSWGYDYNHESAYTKNFIDDVNAFWMNEFKVDGFRFDFTKGFTNTPGDGGAYDAPRIAILQRMANAIWDVNENAYVILEHLAANSEEKELANSGMLLWGNMNFKYKEANMGYNTGDKSDLAWASYKKRGWNDPHVVAYMESHDEERQMIYNFSWGNSNGVYNIKDGETAIERIAMSTLFHTAIPGPKMYWQFGELAYDYSINWPSGTGDDRLTPKPPKWEYQSKWKNMYLHNLTASLNKLKAENDTWETDNFELDVRGAIKTVTLLHSSMDAVIIGNFDVIPQDVEIAFPSSGTWYNFFTDESIEIGAGKTWTTNIVQGAYYLFTNVELPNPNLGTGISNHETQKDQKLQLFPNPVNNQLQIVLDDIANTSLLMIVKDSNGREVMKQKLVSKSNILQENINVEMLEHGMYIIELQTESEVFVNKFLKI